MNSEHQKMLDDMEEILKYNRAKEELVTLLANYLKANQYAVEVKCVGGKNVTPEGYNLSLSDLNIQLGFKFTMENTPDNKNTFIIKAVYNCYGNEVRLYQTLLSFITDEKRKIKFNCDLLESFLNSEI